MVDILEGRYSQFRITVTCRVCKERWDAVQASPNKKLLRDYYYGMYRVHPHNVVIDVEETFDKSYPPRQIEYA